MKRFSLFAFFFFYCFFLSAQPSSFNWATRHGYGYISDAKNQREQGPCSIFASVAAVEAMSQIYFNKHSTFLDLSERYLYNAGGECPGIACQSAASISESLGSISTSGIVDEQCFPYLTSYPYCSDDCDEICSTPSNRVTIPHFERIYPSSENDLRNMIMNYGPIAVNMLNVGCALHPNANPCNYNHSVLLIGWSGSQWIIKDSWPGEQGITSTSIDIYDGYSPSFYRVYPIYNNSTIGCTGSDCSIFSSRSYEDSDHDGFYNWGLDSYPKPAGCPGPDKMDFNDNYGSEIFWDGSTVLQTPTISGTSGHVCPTGSTFTLNNVPTGFSCSWSITKNAYCFSSPTSGTGNSATVYPNSSCTGKEAEITFTISHNGTASYSQSFYANCPREDLMSYYVLDSYGSAPPKYGDTYYLCPYTYYTIYFNESDPNCSVTDLNWDLPYAWSNNYQYDNYISIYTNDVPDGFMEIEGKTTCSPSSRVTLMSPYFGAAECGGYFLAYPNPSGSFVDIDVDKAKLSSENINIDNECLLTLLDKSGMIKFKKEFKGFPFRMDTSNLPDGLYFITISHKGKISTIRLIIKH